MRVRNNQSVLVQRQDADTHQVNSVVELSNEFFASLLGLLEFGDSFAVGPPPQPDREWTQADVVAGRALVEALHCLLLQLCHEEVEKKNNL